MAVNKLSISFDPDLDAATRAAAEGEGLSVSAWLAEAAQAKLRQVALAELVDEWLADGTVTEEGIAAASRSMDVPITGLTVVSIYDDVAAAT